MDEFRRLMLRRSLLGGAHLSGLLGMGGLAGCGGGSSSGPSGAAAARDAGVPTNRTAAAPPPGSVNVRSAPFNARGDGVADDTAALQAAIDAGPPVFVPAGRYRINRLRLRAGLLLQGEEGRATLMQAAAQSMLYASASKTSELLDGITIQDLQLQGAVETAGFSEHVHLVDLRGVRNAKLQRCVLRGFRGDALYLGGQASDGTARHNENVLVIENEFDGVNKDNRNGVSVIDGDGIVIQRNLFHNCTRPNMPGAIDVEPNSGPFHIVRNIMVSSNRFRNIGGNVAAIAIVPARHRYTVAPTNFLVTNNIIDGCDAFGINFLHMPLGGIDDGMPRHDLTVSGNIVRGARRGFGLTGVGGAVIEDNRFSDLDGSMVGYVSPDQRADDVIVRNNHFLHCGSGSGVGFSVHHARRLLLQDNHFDDCGNGGPGAYALDFRAGGSDWVSIIENLFSSASGRTRVAIQRELNHQMVPAHNRFSGNQLNGLPNRFEWALG